MINIIIVYDISSKNNGTKRLIKVAKICEKKCVRVQNSVFCATLDTKEIQKLDEKLNKVIDRQLDSVIFYKIKEYKSSGINKHRDMLSEHLIY